MKCRKCGKEMELYEQNGEDVDYFKYETYLCKDESNCGVSCEVTITGEDKRELLWFDKEGDDFYYEEI